MAIAGEEPGWFAASEVLLWDGGLSVGREALGSLGESPPFPKAAAGHGWIHNRAWIAGRPGLRGRSGNPEVDMLRKRACRAKSKMQTDLCDRSARSRRVRIWNWLRRVRRNERACVLGVFMVMAGRSTAWAQAGQTSPEVESVVRNASWNEVHSSGPPHFFRYRIAEQDAKGSDVKLVIETREGTISRLVEKDGRPLSRAANAAETARLKNLLANPEIQLRRYQQEKENEGREDEMVHMLPDAFLYTSEGMINGPNGPCYRLHFRPNPKFEPKDREGEVFHGMVGEAWIDQRQQRIVKIDAHLIKDVNFGWGVLGRLYRGGSMLEENEDVGGQDAHHWESSLLRLRLKGKILMVKSVDFSTSQISTDFHAVPSTIGYQKAVRMLLDEPVASGPGKGEN